MKHVFVHWSGFRPANSLFPPTAWWSTCSLIWLLQGIAGVLLYCGLSTATYAQTHVWAKRMGGTATEQGQSIAVDGMGNVYTTGSFNGTVDFDPGAGVSNLTSAGSAADIFVSKLDRDGNFVWAKSMGGTSIDIGYSIVVDGTGNVYTTGSFAGTADFDPGAGVSNLTSAVGGTDIFVSKLDREGNFVWAKRMGGASGEQGYSIVVDGTGNVYTTGSFSGTADFDPGADVSNLTSAGLGSDIFVSKLDRDGNFVWAKSMGASGASDIGNDIVVDGTGNVYTTGQFQGTADFDPGAGVSNLTSAGSTDIFVSKLDREGNFVWAKSMSGTSGDIGNDIVVDGTGNVYTTGYFQSTVDFDPGADVSNLTSAGSSDIFVSKLDRDGNFVWAKRMGGTTGEQGRSIAVDGMGNVYTTGPFNGTTDFDPGVGVSNLTSAGISDIFVSKLDRAGNFVWAKSMGGTSTDIGQSIVVDGTGNVYTTGAFQGTVDFDPGAGVSNLTTAGISDIFVSKLHQLEVLAISATRATTNPVCVGNTMDLSVRATGGTPPFTYTWQAPAGATLSATNMAAVSATMTVAGVQTFTVTAVGAGNTPPSIATVSVTISENRAPVATLAIDPSATLSCAQPSATLTALGGTSYIFNGPAVSSQSGNTAVATAAGVYSVTVAIDNGCVATATTTLSDNRAGIAVLGNGNLIAAGDDTPTTTDNTDFGKPDGGIIVNRTFTVHNTGPGPLTISSVALSGAGAASFTVTSAPTQVEAGGTAAVTVSFSANTGGVKQALLTIRSNSCEKAEYGFVLQAEAQVTCTEPVFTTTPASLVQPSSPDQCQAVVVYTALVSGLPEADLSYTFSGATIGIGSGTGSGSVFQRGVTQVTLKGSNGCGSVEYTFTITVEDKQAPAFTAPADRTVALLDGCRFLAPDLLSGLTGSDNCGTVSFTQSPAAGTSLNSAAGMIHPVRIIAKDEAGNTTEKTVTLTAQDEQKPLAIAQNINLSLDATGNATVTAAQVNNGSTDNCTEVGSLKLSLSKSSFACANVGANTVTLTVTDASGNSSSADATVTVQDQLAPVITTNGDKTVANDAGKAGAAVVVNASATDNCVVGQPTGVRSDGKALNAEYPIGATTITWTVTDGNGNAAKEVIQTVEVTNQAPVIASVTASLDPKPVGTALDLTVAYTDNNVTKATINWGDGQTQDVANPSSSFATPHTYSSAGVYTVKVTLTDAGNKRSAEYSYQYIVVYDPDGGFVTGGGWILSPVGAYVKDPGASGKANFGFVSKYQKGANVPTGNTNFEFKAGNLDFKSTSYQWLVVAGAKAQYKGEGTINGGGTFGFMLTSTDGQMPGGGGVDKFRIKIWDKSASDAVVYDNDKGAGDDAAPATALGGGSIVIHNNGKNAREATGIEPGLTVDAMVLRNYPNPVEGKTTFEFMLPQGGDYSLELHDLTGSVIRHLQAGRAQAGLVNQVNWEAGPTPGGLYIGRLTTEQGVKAIKVLVK